MDDVIEGSRKKIYPNSPPLNRPPPSRSPNYSNIKMAGRATNEKIDEEDINKTYDNLDSSDQLVLVTY